MLYKIFMTHDSKYKLVDYEIVNCLHKQTTCVNKQ